MAAIGRRNLRTVLAKLIRKWFQKGNFRMTGFRPKALTGLFLGAGASYELGMPLVWELTAEIKNWLTPEKLRSLNQGWRSQGNGFSDTVINDLAAVLTIDNLHYESVLGHLETQFKRQHNASQEYHGLYSWLVALVYQLLYIRHTHNIQYIDQRLHHYEGISVLSSQNSPLWIFSLNHDLIIEVIAARFSIPITCGFSPNVVTLPRRDASGMIQGELRAEVLMKHDLEHHAMYFPNPGKPGIHLLKIHGALDVFTFNDGNDLLKLIPDVPSTSGIIETLKAANEELLYVDPRMPGGKVHAVNEIAYADEKGEMQFLRRSLLAGAYKYDTRRHQVLPQSLLKHFGANLNFVSRLVCIGYGFGDTHINSILREWLEFHGERTLEIVSPTATIPSFLLHLAPQVSVVKRPATDHLDTLGGIKRSRRDELTKNIFFLCRERGKENTNRDLSEFLRINNDRAIRLFAEKIKEMPFRNGDVDLRGIGEPDAVAKQLAKEINGEEIDMIERLHQFLQSKRCLLTPE